MFKVYSRKSCYSSEEEKVFLNEFNTLDEAWDFMYKHYGKKIYYVRTLLIHPNEYLYDVGSHSEFYSIENTEGEMMLWSAPNAEKK